MTLQTSDQSEARAPAWHTGALILLICVVAISGTVLMGADAASPAVPVARIPTYLSMAIVPLLLTVYVARVKHFSGWAGAYALAIIVVPVVVRTTDDMLKLVPNSLREAAAALGAPSWKVVTMISYRAARAGIVTGVLLAIARITGETAPLLFTALNNQFWSSDMNRPMANLPVVIFQFAMSPYEDWQRLAWGGATLITVFVLGLNIAARALFRK